MLRLSQQTVASYASVVATVGDIPHTSFCYFAKFPISGLDFGVCFSQPVFWQKTYSVHFGSQPVWSECSNKYRHSNGKPTASHKKIKFRSCTFLHCCNHTNQQQRCLCVCCTNPLHNPPTNLRPTALGSVIAARYQHSHTLSTCAVCQQNFPKRPRGLHTSYRLPAAFLPASLDFLRHSDRKIYERTQPTNLNNNLTNLFTYCVPFFLSVPLFSLTYLFITRLSS